jgi:hypothetical protein
MHYGANDAKIMFNVDKYEKGQREMEITVFRERGGSIVFYKAALLIN